VVEFKGFRADTLRKGPLGLAYPCASAQVWCNDACIDVKSDENCGGNRHKNIEGQTRIENNTSVTDYLNKRCEEWHCHYSSLAPVMHSCLGVFNKDRTTEDGSS
jgi:hypothetical protein